jgi:hypothetical protein
MVYIGAELDIAVTLQRRVKSGKLSVGTIALWQNNSTIEQLVAGTTLFTLFARSLKSAVPQSQPGQLSTPNLKVNLGLVCLKVSLD